jgi:ElaB/YqjD/DUF883 family membrane-anchored ribosome-binding protein
MKSVETQDGCTAEALTQAAGTRAKGYVDVGVNALNAVSGKARQLRQNADGYVRDNPWIAVGAAAGVGLLVGYMLRTRRGA